MVNYNDDACTVETNRYVMSVTLGECYGWGIFECEGSLLKELMYGDEECTTEVQCN